MEIRRFVEFEDRKGNIQLLPYIKGVVDETELRCIDVDCVDYECINCDKCPLADNWSLDPGEFKILKPKRSEEK